MTDLPEYGEGALKNALPYDEVPAAKYTKWSDTHSLFVDELKARSAARVAADPEFHYVMEDMERLRQKLDDNRISLNEDVRRHEVGRTEVAQGSALEGAARAPPGRTAAFTGLRSKRSIARSWS